MLLALNRYTRTTADQEEYIMRVPLFGKDLVGKLVADDIRYVIELTMNRKTFESMAKAMHEIMWRDDKNGLYVDLQKYGLPKDFLPEGTAANMVNKNMRGLFAKINQPLHKASEDLGLIKSGTK